VYPAQQRRENCRVIMQKYADDGGMRNDPQRQTDVRRFRP
jgi:hypothetical protein